MLIKSHELIKAVKIISDLQMHYLFDRNFISEQDFLDRWNMSKKCLRNDDLVDDFIACYDMRDCTKCIFCNISTEVAQLGVPLRVETCKTHLNIDFKYDFKDIHRAIKLLRLMELKSYN